MNYDFICVLVGSTYWCPSPTLVGEVGHFQTTERINELHHHHQEERATSPTLHLRVVSPGNLLLREQGQAERHPVDHKGCQPYARSIDAYDLRPAKNLRPPAKNFIANHHYTTARSRSGTCHLLSLCSHSGNTLVSSRRSTRATQHHHTTALARCVLHPSAVFAQWNQPTNSPLLARCVLYALREGFVRVRCLKSSTKEKRATGSRRAGAKRMAP